MLHPSLTKVRAVESSDNRPDRDTGAGDLQVDSAAIDPLSWAVVPLHRPGRSPALHLRGSVGGVLGARFQETEKPPVAASQPENMPEPRQIPQDRIRRFPSSPARGPGPKLVLMRPPPPAPPAKSADPAIRRKRAAGLALLAASLVGVWGAIWSLGDTVCQKPDSHPPAGSSGS